MAEVALEALAARYRRARARRQPWESLWREAFAYAQPLRAGPEFGGAPGANPAERLFDGTAPDAVEQLAASLLAELTPPWSSWFGLVPGSDIAPLEQGAVAEWLDDVGRRVQAHFDRSNFAVEMHQAFLDLATLGTACLLLEEAPLGQSSAFRFTAVPMAEIFVEEGASGHIAGHFRRSLLGFQALSARFPEALLPKEMVEDAERRAERRFEVVESVLPSGRLHLYRAFALDEGGQGCIPLASGQFEISPFLTFRWIKAAGEVYGRSPVMTALPDIKTANKVVELILKNASIAVTGIWQADDDGVLNPANIRLVPGSIIPKAVGSAGLTPLQAPGRFDVSQLVLEDLRARIRHTLLTDRLGPTRGARMTATEVLERSQETTRLLGAIYGRLQSELLTPLVSRALAILRRRGEIPDIRLDGRAVDLHYRSPLARVQARQDVQNTLLWLDAVGRMGEQAQRTVNQAEAARWLGRALGVPGELIRDTAVTEALIGEIAAGIEMVAVAPGEEAGDAS
jgi:hypothetical protein